jgi:hypothetical protein
MLTKEPGFAITGGKGFHITFENGWTVSVQFGPGNYGGNYDRSFRDEGPIPPSTTAEVAAWPNGGEMITLAGGDTVEGYQTPAEVLALLMDVANRPALEASTLQSKGG